MKQNSLQYLLDKYREGTLTDEERTELNRLAHRDEVMSSARSRARSILWHRASLAVGAVAVIGAGVMAVMPRPTEDVMIAEVREVPTTVQVAPEAEHVLRESSEQIAGLLKVPRDTIIFTSVINDIKRFLSV